jgi:signal transduction histidine kinase
LEQQFRPEEALRFWRQLDDILTFALIEATQLSVDIERAVLLEHTVNIRQQLERLEETKTNFIAVAAHELKTPLTILEGYTNMLRYEADPDSKLHAYIDGLENGTQRMNEIISDIIDISLIDSQTFILNYQLFHLEKMVLMVAGRLEKYFEQRSVMLEVIPLGVEVRTFGDPERLSKSLTKVLLNALKYTPDGGKVTIASRLTRQDEGIEGVSDGYVEIQVTDTGIGINPEHLETIFEKFTSATDVTLHSSGKTKFKGGGPGLGLPIAKGLIEAHGGRMWATSPGYDECLFPGSTFHMEIPICLQMPEGKGKRRVRSSNDWEV